MSLGTLPARSREHCPEAARGTPKPLRRTTPPQSQRSRTKSLAAGAARRQSSATYSSCQAATKGMQQGPTLARDCATQKATRVAAQTTAVATRDSSRCHTKPASLWTRPQAEPTRHGGDYLRIPRMYLRKDRL